MNEFKSFTEFEKYYFPESVKEREMKELMKDPEKYGKFIANESLKKIEEILTDE